LFAAVMFCLEACGLSSAGIGPGLSFIFQNLLICCEVWRTAALEALWALGTSEYCSIGGGLGGAAGLPAPVVVVLSSQHLSVVEG